ncbi:MAG: efflux RND transporter periplasmic adaptor subunit [Acidobacteria bacterium]|jgi:RND family efflux transporter MFP subunit|nr:efflux RND transporter periplasmic adaptor subunit [Acidobacteriota bacterium]
MKKNIMLLFPLILITALVACQKKQDTATVAAAAESLRVEVKTVVPEKFEHFFAVNGALEAIQDAFISAETSGQIQVVHVQEGQRVLKGDLLVTLNSDITRNAVAEVNNALQLARIVFRKRQELWDRRIGAEIQYLEAKTSKESLENRLASLQAQLALAQVKAPFNGIVDKIFKKSGELAVPGLQLMQLVNLNRMRVNAEVAETYLGRMQKGDRIEVTFPTYPGLSLETAISRIGQVVSAKNRTVLVQAELDNRREQMKPNMMATLRLRDFYDPAALVVPAIVVKNDLEGTYLYIVERENDRDVARKVYVTTGLTEGNRTMVTSGLAAGQDVIVSGYNLVRNGLPVAAGK